MPEERVLRRLAAILAADVVGYSRLMGENEEGTLATLTAHLSELIEPCITEHRGRVVKTTGDGLLAEFASVVDAVRCAVVFQDGMAARNSKTPEDQRIEFRIGVNLGDLIVQEDDVYGDGVNVAARLEGLSEPSGVVVSGMVHEAVRAKLDVAFDDLGPQTFKNIAEPVPAFRVVSSSKASTSAGAPPPLPDKPSIAVLPFDNMSGDAEQGYFADGISEEIITALSKVSRMRVIARNSTFSYKGSSTDVRTVAEELGVRYVLEGSVRRSGDRIRVTAQLVDAADGSHLWAERSDRVVEDMFDIQDEITKEIVTYLRVKLTDGEEVLVWARGTKNIEAWQYGVRASELFIRYNGADHLESRKFALRATELDPDYAHAWAALGFTYWYESRLGFTGDPEAKFEKAREIADRAMALDDTVSWAIGLSAMVAATEGRCDEGIVIAERGVEFHPGNADVRAFLSFALMYAGRYEDAIQHIRAAMALNPFSPGWYRNSLCRSLIFLDRLEEALPVANQILSSEPEFLYAWLYRAYVLQRLDRRDEAREAVREIIRLTPMFGSRHLSRLLPHLGPAELNRFAEVLGAAGLPE